MVDKLKSNLLLVLEGHEFLCLQITIMLGDHLKSHSTNVHVRTDAASSAAAFVSQSDKQFGLSHTT